MDALLTEIIAETLNMDMGTSQPQPQQQQQRRRRQTEDDASDLNRFIRPGDTAEQNIRLLEAIRTIESERHAYDVRRRQLRIVSDLMEDYQYNIQLFLQLISTNMRSSEPANRSRISRPQPQQTPRPTPSYTYHARTGLTDRQVELGTRTVVYEASMNETRCPIALDDFAVGEEIAQIVGCGHVFKCAPLREWFRRNSHCPVCRYNLTTSSGRVRAVMRDNTFVQGNTNAHYSSLFQGNTRTNSDMWTTLFTGLIPNREYVIPLSFETGGDTIPEMD
jgi:Ring finger domain